MIDAILQIRRRCNFADEIGKSFDLTLGDVEGLLAIAGNQGLASKDLAELLRLSPSRGSRVIGRLMGKGLVEARADQGDRRSLVLTLTPKGVTCHLQLLEEKALCEQRLRAQLDVEQINIIESGLDSLLKVM